MTDESATPSPTSPSSWRDVYGLVRDTRTDVLAAVTIVDEKVAHLTTRVNAIELGRAGEAGADREQTRILGMGKTSLAIAVALVSALVSVANAVALSGVQK